MFDQPLGSWDTKNVQVPETLIDWWSILGGTLYCGVPPCTGARGVATHCIALRRNTACCGANVPFCIIGTLYDVLGPIPESPVPGIREVPFHGFVRAFVPTESGRAATVQSMSGMLGELAWVLKQRAQE